MEYCHYEKLTAEKKTRYSEPSVYTLGGAQPWLDAQGGQRPMSVFIETLGVGGSMKKSINQTNFRNSDEQPGRIFPRDSDQGGKNGKWIGQNTHDCKQEQHDVIEIPANHLQFHCNRWRNA